MTIGLRFTDGTTTLNVSDLTNGILTRYQSGNNNALVEETTDKIMVVLRGSRATKLANIGTLNSFFQLATDRQQKPYLSKLFVERDSGDGVWWRSEIVSGLVMLDADSIDAIERSPEISIVFTRKNFWEGAEAQIALSNGNGTNNTAGLTVYNCNDGVGTSPNKRNNYVQIAAGVISGDMPAPVRLEITNTYNSAAQLYTVWLSHNVESDPANFQNIIEAEAAAAGGTDTTNSSFSGGKYRTFTWSGDNQALIGRWVLDTAYLNKTKSSWFKILAAFTGSPSSGTRLQCKLRFPSDSALTEISSSQEVVLSTSYRIQDIGTLQLPPWLAGAGDQVAIAFCLYARKSGGGSLGIDYFQFSPIDSYRILQPRGYGAALNERIVDDGIAGLLYGDQWTSQPGKIGIYTGQGKPVLLKPAKIQRIYFLMRSNTDGIPIDRTISVKAYYRPRKATL
jgi:hypothetical protein